MQNFLLFSNSTVQSEDGHVFFSCALLWLHESCGALYTYDEATSDLGVKRTAVACLFNTKYALDPGNNLVRWRIGWFIQINEATPE